MDASDLARGEVMSLRTTVLGQTTKIRELHVVDRKRQIVTSKMLRADHRRFAEIRGLRTADHTKQQDRSPDYKDSRDPLEILHSQSYQRRLAMLDQGVTAALAAHDALKSTNGNESHNSGTGVRRTEQATRECTYTDFLKCQPLHFKGTEGVASLSQWLEKIKRMFPEESDKIERYIGGLPDMIHGSVVAFKPNTMQEAVEIATELMDKEIRTFAERETESKRKSTTNTNNGNNQGHFKRECLKMKNNNNHGNQCGRDNAPAKVYALGRAGTDPDSNVVTGMFLLNNRYASVLFDTGADKSFVSTAFSSQINIMPSTLDHCYDVELADGRIIGLNTILRGCTLNLLNHPFNINLMPVELGSFDAIIGMDWLAKYQAVIACAKKIARIPWGNETLIIHGDGNNQGNAT
uniref:Reverse transcriptase domain-containing protein n=1 Tax=Tanacetum cinerariifolium TaxID=118510 RepID=A0A6L2L611_TANCI|nr:hypothetical protein [Tanacetum cinerariifolium]